MANVKDLIVNGAARVLGKLYASEFVGNLTGNATTATGDAYATKSELSNYIPNYGTTVHLGNGDTCTTPSNMAASSVFSWRKTGGTSKDANIMYSSEDGAFFANSGDCGYVFAIYDTDVTGGNFADLSQPLFKVKQQGDNGYCVARYGFTAPAVEGAVFNDLADAIPVGEGDALEAGYCYGFDGEHYAKTSEYMQKSYIGIHSDTFGFLMGHEEGKEKLNVAVSGFVLAYVDKEYEVGTPLTCTTDGCLTEIKFEDKMKYPERIVATYWKNEPNEEWGSEDKKVRVKGRKWVKVK